MEKPDSPTEAFRNQYHFHYGYGGQKQAAKEIGISPQYMGDLLKGNRPITPQVALKLEKAWGVDAEYWVILQARYDLWKLRQEAENGEPKSKEG